MSKWTYIMLSALALALASLTSVAIAAERPASIAGGTAIRWSAAELSTLATLRLSQLPEPPADPSNRVEGDAAAIELGKRLFNDARLSRNGEVACATCHAPDRQFQDGLPRGRGLAEGARRSMPIVAAAHSPWLFWDGRKDSLWSQALGPLEDPAEHGGNRARLVATLLRHYGPEYAALFGAAPELSKLQPDASPLGTERERAAWATLDQGTRESINRVFANLGKTIAAFERTLRYGPSRFDRYVEAVVDGKAQGRDALSAEEQRGLQLFIGKAQCATCHNGPLLTDQHFHNTGVPAVPGRAADRGRADAIAKVRADEFNCLGPFSDVGAAGIGGCEELRFIATGDSRMLGAFKTPGLRNIALRPPYMHAGQFATLEEVVGHYAASPLAAIGHSELARPGERHAERKPIQLTAAEQRALVAFLKTLDGPIVESRGATLARTP